jgi:hypothetical protein
MLRLTALLVLLSLAGCASTVTFSSRTSPELATVVGQMDREGAFNWRAFVLVAVDDKPVSHGFLSDTRDTVVRVEAGEHRFVVQAGFNTGFGGPGPYEAIVLLMASVEKGKTYRVNGAVRDNLYFVWLEDPTTGARVSQEASAPYSVSSSRDTYIPIYIPP